MEALLINIRTQGDDKRGYLSFFEAKKDIPFSIKRIYYIYETPINVKRGLHAHKKLQQLLWCPHGSIEIMLDDGKEQNLIKLDSPAKGLVVSAGYWREMEWKIEGSILCVAASADFDEGDYIRDYDEFLKYVEEGYWANGN